MARIFAPDIAQRFQQARNLVSIFARPCQSSSVARKTHLSLKGITALVAIVAISFVAVLAEEEPLDPEVAIDPDTDTSYLSLVMNEPGLPEKASFASFENGETVNLFNGNLNVRHAVSPVYPLTGGRKLALALTFDVNNVRIEEDEQSCCEAETPPDISGDSWVGRGWNLHLGQISKRNFYVGCSSIGAACPHSTWPLYHHGLIYRTPDGTEHSADEHGMWLGDPQPEIKVDYWTTNLSECEPVAGGGACQLDEDGPNRYVVTTDDGTRYVMEQIVPYVYGYHARNFVRNKYEGGFYTTSITDVFGDVVNVEYYRTGAFPQAIKRVTYGYPSGRALELSATLWDATDAPEASSVGRLKTLTVPVANGQTASYRFYYEGTKLSRVELPDAGAGSPAGQIEYEYLGFRISGITYPLGAKSEYTYAPAFVGERDRCTRFQMHQQGCFVNVGTECGCAIESMEDEACEFTCAGKPAAWKHLIGANTRTMWPEGKGSGKPSYQWRWERAAYRVGGEPHHFFNLIHPDGRREESKFYVYPFMWDMGSSPDSPFSGREYERVYKSADGTVVRTQRFNYAGACVGSDGKAKSTTYFNDEAAGCFAGALGVTPTTESLNVSCASPNRARMNILTGAHMKGGASRIAFKNYELPTDNNCRRDKHFLGAYDQAFVEENGQRVETNVVMGTGTWCTLPDRIEKRVTMATASTIVTDPLNPQWQPNATNPPRTIADFDYTANGDLDGVNYSGGDADPISNTTATYSADYTVELGLPVKLELAGGTLGYLTRDLTADVASTVVSSRDPNGLETMFSYDVLGRMTKRDPSGSFEFASRVAYPDLNTLRVIRSSGTEENYSPTISSQEFLERRFDGLGRLAEIRKALPDNRISVQVTRYDQVGRPIFVSEWLDASIYDSHSSETVWSDGLNYWVNVPVDGTGRPKGTVTYYGQPNAAEPGNPLKAAVDALGREVRVVRVDGSVVGTTYCGTHKEVRIEDVRTGVDGSETDSVTRYYYDDLGRLVIVDPEVGEATPTAANAVYDYDPLGNVIKVTLIDQVTLGTNPFDTWKAGGFNNASGQVRRFGYDALGRLRWSIIPEAGEVPSPTTDCAATPTPAACTVYDRYDAWGNLIAWRDPLAVKRGYFFRNVYDVAGRRIKTEKIQGSPDAPLPGADQVRITHKTLNTPTEVLQSSWERGSISGTSFVSALPSTAEANWRWQAYTSTSCIPAPPGHVAGGGGLYFGLQCSYGIMSAPTTPQVVRHLATNVSKDDVLTFKYWRQVREGTGTLDAFSVFIVEATGDGSSVQERRNIFRLDQSQSSYARWQASPAVRPADFFSDWEEGTQKNLYVYFEFLKGDAAPSGLGKGIMIDDIHVGRSGTETLSEAVYDVSACGIRGATEECAGGDQTHNDSLGKLTQLLSYQDGRLISDRRFVYKGVNGRLSGVQQAIDPEGDGTAHEFVTRWNYGANGLPIEWYSPYVAGSGAAVGYGYTYIRGFLSGIMTADGALVPTNPPGFKYNLAGGASEIRFANGAKTTLATDAMFRPLFYTVHGGTGSPFWASGIYSYDSAGNVASIGNQKFAYDLVGRLREAQVLPQATRPTEQVLRSVTHTYDLFGNMKSQDWDGDGSFAEEVPMLGEFLTRNYGATPATNRNRILDEGFSHDLNGNMTRMNMGGLRTATVWDPQNRMTASFHGDVDAGTAGIVEHYAYDAAGFRVIRVPDAADGKPVLSVRDDNGQLLAEFVEEPSSQMPHLVKHFVYGLGQLLVERAPSGIPPTLLAEGLAGGQAGYSMKIPTAAGGDIYAVDIRTADGAVVALTGIVPDTEGRFTISESDLTPWVNNWIRVRKETNEAEPYSAPVVVAFDPNVTPTSENQVRGVAVGRLGKQIVIRWAQQVTNDKRLNLYFRRPIDETAMLLNSAPMESMTGEFVIPDQTLSELCGAFSVTQVDIEGIETARSVEFFMPTAASGTLLAPDDPPSGCVNPPGGGGGASISFTNAFHHRDHLGNLRVVTDGAGQKVSGHDFYPFGTEIGIDDGLGSRKRFIGHERDTATGMDYMLARYYSSSLSRFLSTDPSLGSVVPGGPQTWNRYSYAFNNPLSLLDPDGREVKPSHQTATYPVTGNLSQVATQVNQRGGYASDTVTALRVGDVKQHVVSGELTSGGFTAKATVTSANVYVSTTTTLPSWTNASSAPAGDQQTFSNFSTALQAHENGHVDRSNMGATALDQAVPGTTATGTGPTREAAISAATGAVDTQLGQMTQSASQGIQTQQDDYDKNTNHGATQGAVLDPNKRN